MDFTQSFEDFSRGLSTTDLALYGGVALVVWVLFKDKLMPLTEYVKVALSKVTNKVKDTIPKNSVPSISDLTMISSLKNESSLKPQVAVGVDDVFFDLVLSWKKTRDLAVKSGCKNAVKVADEMFPHLSPEVCKEGLTNE
jgi:hypothetical protein